jgi:hypothetical protein
MRGEDPHPNPSPCAQGEGLSAVGTPRYDAEGFIWNRFERGEEMG